MKIQSVRYYFAWEGKKLCLKKAMASLALPYPSSPLDPADGLTGTWAELADEKGAPLYRLNLYAMLHAVSEDTVSPRTQFEILMPCLPEAKTLRLFAPPCGQDGSVCVFGPKSILLEEFPIPAPEYHIRDKEVKLPEDICGKGRGLVLSKTQIKVAADVENAYNLIILADRFREDQTKFIDTAYRCVNYLYSRPPFTDMIGYSSMNIWLVQVQSFPKERSYFDTVYSSKSTGVNWNGNYVNQVCNALFSKDGASYWNWAGIIINDDDADIGTSGGNQFAISTFSSSWSNNHPWMVFQHEFGHSAFSLADEYSNKGSQYDFYNGKEPSNPNITKEHTLDQLKWRALVTEGTPIPTDKSYGEDHKGAVGCYEGGGYYRHGIYRPKYHCVMRNQRDEDVKGYYCPVCLAEAERILSRTLDARVPSPSIIYYSNSSGKWDHYLVPTGITRKYGRLENWKRFDELVSALRKGAVEDVVVSLMYESAKIELGYDTEILPTAEDGENKRGVWYLRPASGKSLYYVITYKAHGKTEINTGELKVPPYFEASVFEGVTLGLQQHLFSADGEKLYYGIIDANGVLSQEFQEQKVNGLSKEITRVSVALQSAIIWTAVVDGGKVKLGAYSRNSKSWLPCGFMEMPGTETAEYRNVKLFQANGKDLYILAQGTDGLVLQTFDGTYRKWDDEGGRLLAGTQDLLQYDFVCSNGILWIAAQTVSGIEVVKYDPASRVLTSAAGPASAPADGVITSISCTVQGNQLHIVYLLDGCAVHERYLIRYDYEKAQYEADYEDSSEITLLSTEKNRMAALSLQNDGHRIYMIVSTKQEIP